MANNGNGSESSVSGTESMERIMERAVTSFLQALQTNINNGMPERTEVYRSCTISLKGKTLYVDLIPICIGNVDVILEMDWLAVNHAFIDCKAKKAPTVDAIPVVQEFLDIFPEDLPGIPVDREIEFTIETQPGTEPISKAPYCMSMAKLKEMKTQLLELLDKRLHST
ncbi:uncharacterized protein LOC114275056 [Camellia sinensis]|uniref:uncharacterized protein LOC114275056 n=1 Tax=Camellia sinensis TaxID=4442 RepID=UPI001035F4F2|nr:uncharacterized protein LOC114275056 [Camellia sinensis]